MHTNGNGHADGNGGIRAPPQLRGLASTGFLSLWDLANTGFLFGFFVFCTDYSQYWFSNILRISRVLVFL